GGAAPREKDGQSAPTGSFVAFSKDGVDWTKPQIVSEPGRWLWSATWHEGKAYGVSYAAGAGERHLSLLVSEDGLAFKPVVERLYGEGFPNETALRFTSDGTCYALVRRDKGGDGPYSAILGVSGGDFTKWNWHDLGAEFNGFGGPNFIQLPTGQWLAAGRMHEGGAHTALCRLDVTEHKMTKLLKLPSGGDTSYPGLLWHDGLLYLSYYSSHEGKTSIYLARIKIAP
ncbi:MAG: exo-alpha-sialidase, partial [Planctomycetes bacterium]|nr:exo-alpha-sialidase [Planctomycetota bacterium]